MEIWDELQSLLDGCSKEEMRSVFDRLIVYWSDENHEEIIQYIKHVNKIGLAELERQQEEAVRLASMFE